MRDTGLSQYMFECKVCWTKWTYMTLVCKCIFNQKPSLKCINIWNVFSHIACCQKDVIAWLLFIWRIWFYLFLTSRSDLEAGLIYENSQYRVTEPLTFNLSASCTLITTLRAAMNNLSFHWQKTNQQDKQDKLLFIVVQTFSIQHTVNFPISFL